jgi:transposase
VVRRQFQLDPLSGQLFVFTNKRADRIELRYRDEDGFVILYKRLEAGAFHPPKADAVRVAPRAADLRMLLGGVDLDSVRRSRRHRRPAPDS